jgi:hypothetical protein
MGIIVRFILLSGFLHQTTKKTFSVTTLSEGQVGKQVNAKPCKFFLKRLMECRPTLNTTHWLEVAQNFQCSSSRSADRKFAQYPKRFEGTLTSRHLRLPKTVLFQYC